jgi:hypothetical protein
MPTMGWWGDVERPAATGIKHTSSSKDSLQLEAFGPVDWFAFSSTLPRNVNLRQNNHEEFNAYLRTSGKYLWNSISFIYFQMQDNKL